MLAGVRLGVLGVGSDLARATRQPSTKSRCSVLADCQRPEAQPVLPAGLFSTFQFQDQLPLEALRSWDRAAEGALLPSALV